MRSTLWLMPALLAAAVTAALMPTFTGCEDDPATLDTVDPYFASNPLQNDSREPGSVWLAVEPASATIAIVDESVGFRAKGGTPPFDWRVSSQDRGTVARSTVNSDSAVYTCKEVGPNSIVVTDNDGRTVSVPINARGLDVFRLTPETVSLFRPRVGDTVRFVASGGVPPYRSWAVAFPALGTIDDFGIYRVAANLTLGTNVISVLDAAGTLATATVKHRLEPDALEVLPSTASLGRDGEEAWFLASGGLTGYQWSVTYPARGLIVSVSADTATMKYRRTGPGDNTIVLRDAVGASVSFTVSQPAPLPPVISPASASLSTNQFSQVFAVNGGTPSYVWSVVNGLGTVAPSVGSQTVYTRGASDPAGNYIIRVTDSSGLSSLATIVQQ